MLPPPSVLLGVDSFHNWRPHQDATVSEILSWMTSSERFLCMSAPTGSGKSLTAVLSAKLSDKRTVILTATKGLQDQIMGDFGTMAKNVKGQNNFMCIQVDGLRADEGPCHSGLACPYKSKGCRYYEQLNEAKASHIVVTNYAYYLAQTKHSDGLGDVDLLVMDEANMAFSALESYLKVNLAPVDVGPMGIQLTNRELPWEEWQDWALRNMYRASETVEELKNQIREMRETGEHIPSSLYRAHKTARNTHRKIMTLASAQGDWVIQRFGSTGWEFTPVWVNEYSSLIFQDTDKIMLMSAFMSQKVADNLGVPTEQHWIDVPSSFPAVNTPIWHIPTARINFRTDDYGTAVWAARIDQVISRRMDRKGMVFTVSYRRRDLLMQKSRYAGLMFSHSTRDVIEMVKRFKAANPPAIFVSPSVTSGWDFPEDDCRYIIIGKIPYPDTRDLVLQARQEADRDWSSFMAMETLVQEAGRGTRSMQDQCEVFVVDDSWKWYWARYKHYAPAWFQERVLGSMASVPDPLIKEGVCHVDVE